MDRQIDGLTSSIHKKGLVMKSGHKEYIYRKVFFFVKNEK